MTPKESVMIVRYMNKVGKIPNTSQRLITYRACADEAMRRLRAGKRKAVKILWITQKELKVLDNHGETVIIPLQKHSYFRTIIMDLEDQFFLPNTLQWRWYARA